ncbi:MAG: pyridoxal phosphate-dependent aminotransferase family protein [Maribacter sp.]
MVYYIDEFPGREIKIRDKKLLYFGGTSYLGLQTDEAFQNILIKNIKKYGTNYGASRKSNVRLSVFDNAEKLLAKMVGCESSVTLSSGYLAGQFVAQYFNTPNYKLFYAPNTHSALYNNYNKPYATFRVLNNAIREQLALNNKIVPVVFLDSIDFEGDNYPDFTGLQSLPLDKVILIADDSHGIGIIGKEGEGIYRKLKGLNARELLVCCSLGKSYGIQAGAVFGNSERLEQLTDTPFFGGASPAAPASIATFIEAQSIFNMKRKLLLSNIGLFMTSVQNISYFRTMKGHPSFSFQDSYLTTYLEEKGFVLTNFNYPEESSSLMSRIVLSSHHTQKDIEQLAKTLNTFFSLKS